MSKCIYDSATSLAKTIRDKQLSAVEVVSTHFERIEAVNGQLNALVQLASARAGATTDNLPIGVQIVRRPWREDVVFAIAQAIETSLGGYQRPPL